MNISPQIHQPPQVNKWVVALSVASGSLMATIDSSIVNVAIPHIRGAVGATIEEITWISIAYTISMVMVMPLTGLLGALFGQKRLYLTSLVVFVIGSVLCGTSRTLPTLIFFRVIQGLGAGALQPSQQAILRQTFPPSEQGMAMAIFSMVIMVGPAIGPTLGGWITDTYSWPWIFFINLPVGILGIYMAYRNVHDPEEVRAANLLRAVQLRQNMDWLGIALMIVAVSSLQYFLEEGHSKDWFESKVILACAFVAFFSIVAFIIRELTFPYPVVNLRLFRDRIFFSGTIISSLVFATLMGSMFLLPVFTQELLGYDATLSGLILMPRTLAMLAITPFVGRLYNKIPPRVIVGVGAVIFVIGNFLLGRITLLSGVRELTFPLVITGFGLACLMIPLNTVALSSVAPKDLADAAGLNSFMRQIGGSAGLTIFVTLLGRFASEGRASLSAQVTLLRPEVASSFEFLSFRMRGLVFDHNLADALAIKILNGKVAVQAMVLAFEKSFLLQGLSFVFVIPLILFLKDNRKKIELNTEGLE